MKNILLSSIFISLVFFNAASASDSRAGTSAFSFLKIGAGARAAGMGESFTAVANDVSALYWNPAGIAQLENRIQASITHNIWLDGISHDFAGCIFQFDQFQMITFGASLVTLTAGSIEGFDASDAPSGTYTAGNTAIALSAAKAVVSDSIYAGFTIKDAMETLETHSASALAVDIGGLYRLSPQISLGACMQNIGTGVKYVSQEYALPFTLKAGACYMSDPYSSDHPYTVSADMVIPNDNSVRVNAGCEYVLNALVDLRAGYANGGLTFGAGGKFTVGETRGLLVDIALSPYGSAGMSTRLSATLKF